MLRACAYHLFWCTPSWIKCSYACVESCTCNALWDTPGRQVCGKAGNARLLQADTHIDERHRHRYEVNPALIDSFEEAGLRFVGKDESGQRMEVIELPSHPFFVAAQFHPEFKSRPFKPSPLFLVGVLASVAQHVNYKHML